MQPRREFLQPSRHIVDANACLRHPAEGGAWIWHPSCPKDQTAVLRFTRRFKIDAPVSILIHVTADQRFQLLCDGKDVSFGPDRCDVEHWTVQSVRIDMDAGEHEMEALVWWIAEAEGGPSRIDQDGSDLRPQPPMAQMTLRGGFLLYTEDLPVDVLNTGSSAWEVGDLTPAVRMFRQRIPFYFDVGPSFEFDLDFWQGVRREQAVVVRAPIVPNKFGVRAPGWCLYPANLPEQRREMWAGGKIRAARWSWNEDAFGRGEEEMADDFAALTGGGTVIVPPHSRLTLLWDLQDYLCGYPRFSTRGGRGAEIEWDWAESLYREPSASTIGSTSLKDDRGAVFGKSFLGYGDRWKIGGGAITDFPFLWWRCGRYVRLRVATNGEALEIGGLSLVQTGYPLELGGSWQSSDDSWNRLMPIFERAFRASAHETWTDSPYYEQMCYVGDNALHALSNYAWFTDDRLSRRSLALFDWSRRPSGLVAERYPSAWRQESITYSMLWPMMIRDFAWWRDDADFVAGFLPGMRSMLAEIEGYKHSGGLLREAPGWPFVDWVSGWDEGCGPGMRDGDSSILNLHWVLCLQAAAQIEETHGDSVLARRCHRLAKETFAAVIDRYWDNERGIFLDTVGVEQGSEHAQSFALLTGYLEEDKRRRCLAALAGRSQLSEVTISASFYLLEALHRNGAEEEFHKRLDAWRVLPGLGFKSTPEMHEPSRSDAHAWGAHPAWHSIASIAGIRPASPGYASVSIAPMPGNFTSINCSCVHPKGQIRMNWRPDHAEVTLPEGVNGQFIWRGTKQGLVPGTSRVAFAAGHA